MTEHKLNIRALVFCLLNHYLLSNNNGAFGDIRLIPLISQMESCYSIMPLVVAETLLSADELKKDAKSEYFKGSPLLLQIWLVERLRLLEAPADPKHYRPIALGNQKYLHQGQDEPEWTSFFTYGICSIKWVVPWLMSGVDTEFVSDDVWADAWHIFVGPCEAIRVGFEKCNELRPDVVGYIASNKDDLFWFRRIQDDLVELFRFGLFVACWFGVGL
ncbi:uncharacterized protein [Spinacia oleracea]|uniref:Aminotransferase-like plant mobile domain-containing protein n=1 Tax=Spinacia oleracea TaxID=3562 RepID=A0ABM3QRP7_SPIOL|nr:uncharacterized protein LOC130461824 [Spinacia oleracea]